MIKTSLPLTLTSINNYYWVIQYHVLIQYDPLLKNIDRNCFDWVFNHLLYYFGTFCSCFAKLLTRILWNVEPTYGTYIWNLHNEYHKTYTKKANEALAIVIKKNGLPYKISWTKNCQMCLFTLSRNKFHICSFHN